jgi:hypothetical protein
MAMLNIMVFSLAGLLSSQVTQSKTQEVLVTGGSNCGMWQFANSFTDAAASEAWASKVLNDSITAAAYARNCYKDGDGMLGCNLYVNNELPWTSDVNATCPFASGLCVGGDTAAYSMDTGILESQEALGINTPSWERITYRKVTT